MNRGSGVVDGRRRRAYCSSEQGGRVLSECRDALGEPAAELLDVDGYTGHHFDHRPGPENR